MENLVTWYKFTFAVNVMLNLSNSNDDVKSSNGAPNENTVQNQFNIASLNVF